MRPAAALIACWRSARAGTSRNRSVRRNFAPSWNGHWGRPVLEGDRVLRESVDDVLEKMFFIRTLGESAGTSGQPEIIAYLTFEGRPSGSFTLRASLAAARSITADFLGDDEEALGEAQVGEVICEL